MVVSDQLEVDPDAPWAHRTQAIARKETARFKESGRVSASCRQPDQVERPLASELVDERRLMVGATALGSGVSLVEAPSHQRNVLRTGWHQPVNIERHRLRVIPVIRIAAGWQSLAVSPRQGPFR